MPEASSSGSAIGSRGGNYILTPQFVGLERPLSQDEAESGHPFQIIITKLDGFLLEFDFIIPTPIANALRRILIAEVPTMAIENVYIFDNSSVMHDEILASRLGLIPIKVDPRQFEFIGRDEEPTDLNTLVFKLNVKCTLNTKADPNEKDPSKKYLHSSVYSGDMVWAPQGNQQNVFEDIRPVEEDILITKLRPGEELNLEMHCWKGIGKTHAKWSPVGTASYRLMPFIDMKEPITGDLAEKFKHCFVDGVISVSENEKGVKEAKVANPRKDTCSREVLRHEEFKDKVRLGRHRDHHLFFIESTGCLSPDDLFVEALNVLIQKCDILKEALDQQAVLR